MLHVVQHLDHRLHLILQNIAKCLITYIVGFNSLTVLQY